MYDSVALNLGINDGSFEDSFYFTEVSPHNSTFAYQSDFSLIYGTDFDKVLAFSTNKVDSFHVLTGSIFPKSIQSSVDHLLPPDITSSSNAASDGCQILQDLPRPIQHSVGVYAL